MFIQLASMRGRIFCRRLAASRMTYHTRPVTRVCVVVGLSLASYGHLRDDLEHTQIIFNLNNGLL